MTRKRKRLIFVVGGLVCLGVATALVLDVFNDNLVFFKTPTDMVTDATLQGRHVRIGGLVEDKSVKKEDGGKTIEFRITDGNNASFLDKVHFQPLPAEVAKSSDAQIVKISGQ